MCSHPMALAQAASWLRRELPEARLDEVDSTAEAARRAALEPGVAAIGSVLAAGANGLTVLAQHPGCPREHHALYRAGPCLVARTGEDKTSVVFSVKDRPGVLKDALSAFAEEGINLTASRAVRAASAPGPTCSSRTSSVTPRRTG